MNAFTFLSEIGFVLVWCNPRVCPERIPIMASWSDDSQLVKPVTQTEEVAAIMWQRKLL
jgi:hypothetical protein